MGDSGTRRVTAGIAAGGRFSGVAADLLGGAGSALLGLAGVLSTGVVAYQSLGPAFIGAGISAAFVTYIVCGLIDFFLAGSPLHISSPKAALAAMLAGLIGAALATPDFAAGLPTDPAARGSILIALATLAVILGGAIELVLFAGGLSRLVRYLPYPVVAGFLNGFAIQIAIAQLPHALGLQELSDIRNVFSGVEAIDPWATGVALFSGLVSLLLPRIAPRMPGAIVALITGTMLYYGLAFVLGLGRPALVVGPMPASLPVGFGLAHVHQLFAVPGFRAVIGELLITALTVAIINTIQGAMNLTAGDVLFGVRHDDAKELRTQGVGNVLSGLLGGLTGSGSALFTAVAFANGARTRVANLGFVLALAVLGLALRPAIALLPYAVIAGVVIALCYSLADSWTREVVQRAIFRSGRSWHPTMAVDMALVVLVTFLVVFTSTALALGIGVSVSSLVFLRRASEGAVRRVTRANVVRSRTGRAQDVIAALDEHGSRIALVELQGSLFFGTMPVIEQIVDQLGAGVESVILDLHRVHLIDSTGAISLRRLEQDLRRGGAQLLLASLPKNGPAWHRLEVAGFSERELDARCFPDRDHALAHAEDRLLAHLGLEIDPRQELDLREFDACHGLDERDLGELARLVEQVIIPAGQDVVREGDPGNSMFLLARGKVAITTQNAHVRLAGYEAGVAFGEAAMLTGEPRNATVRAETDVVLYEISRVAFARFASDFPVGALAIMTNLARIQSQRVRELNATVRALSA